MGFFGAFFPSEHIEDKKSVEFASVAICSTVFFNKMTEKAFPYKNIG